MRNLRIRKSLAMIALAGAWLVACSDATGVEQNGERDAVRRSTGALESSGLVLPPELLQPCATAKAGDPCAVMDAAGQAYDGVCVRVPMGPVLACLVPPSAPSVCRWCGD